jgi:flagellar motor switch protein FliN/FliY
MTEAPYFWIRKIESHLRQHDAIPLFGLAPDFDWAHFSSALAARLGVQDLTITKKQQQWRSADDLTAGLGGNLGNDIITLPLQIGSFSGHAYWMMPKESIAKLTSWMMHGQTKTRPISSEILAVGFYRYLILQTLDCANSEDSLQQLSILLNQPSSVPETDAFCIDIAIEFNKLTCSGRLAIDPTLQRSWREHFSTSPTDYIPAKIAQITELTASIKIGSTLLSPKEWKMLKVGDFVALDSGSYHPKKNTGAAYLTVGTTPLFQVKVKHNKIELIDYAFMYEEEMDKHHAESQESPNHTEAELMPAATEEAVTLKELPMNVTVEIARLRITLEKLLQLVPGNMIELPIKPDQPVHLTVGGQLVGKAELVHLGDSLGIRIIEIG